MNGEINWETSGKNNGESIGKSVEKSVGKTMGKSIGKSVGKPVGNQWGNQGKLMRKSDHVDRMWGHQIMLIEWTLNPFSRVNFPGFPPIKVNVQCIIV